MQREPAKAAAQLNLRGIRDCPEIDRNATILAVLLRESCELRHASVRSDKVNLRFEREHGGWRKSVLPSPVLLGMDIRASNGQKQRPDQCHLTKDGCVITLSCWSRLSPLVSFSD